MTFPFIPDERPSIADLVEMFSRRGPRSSWGVDLWVDLRDADEFARAIRVDPRTRGPYVRERELKVSATDGSPMVVFRRTDEWLH